MSNDAIAAQGPLDRGVRGWRPPEKGSSHWKFYEHIKAGGRVWRDDPLNNVRQWVTIETLGGDAAKICKFGYADLSIKDEAPNGEVRGASRLAGEASASTVVLAGTTGRKE